jgi:hypothetical protein
LIISDLDNKLGVLGWWTQKDINILLTSYLTLESRIQIWRTVEERVAQIAPFLRLDTDPYPALSAGKLYWIQDAYTDSDQFPYPLELTSLCADPFVSTSRGAFAALAEERTREIISFVSGLSRTLSRSVGESSRGLILSSPKSRQARYDDNDRWPDLLAYPTLALRERTFVVSASQR